MQAYSNVAAIFNLPVQLPVTPGVWTLEQRKARLRERNPNFTTGRSLKRRDAAELNVRDVQLWLDALLHGRAVSLRVKKRHQLVDAPLYVRLARCTPALLDLRAKIRAGVSWLVEHGPGSGWALPNPEWASESTSNFTPYYVPRANLYGAERWVRVAARVGQLVRLFVALLSKVSPAPRSARTEPHRQEQQEAVPTREEREAAGYRTHSPPERGGPPRSLADVLADVRRKFGEGGDDERRG